MNDARRTVTSRFVLASIAAACILSSLGSGCANWCSTSQGLQTKSQAKGQCKTPGDHKQAKLVN